MGESESPADWRGRLLLSKVDNVEVSGWDLVSLGITVPRSYFCICCLSFHGTGMHRHGVTYCVPCWELRQQGIPCSHPSSLPGGAQQQLAG